MTEPNQPSTDKDNSFRSGCLLVVALVIVLAILVVASGFRPWAVGAALVALLAVVVVTGVRSGKSGRKGMFKGMLVGLAIMGGLIVLLFSACAILFRSM